MVGDSDISGWSGTRPYEKREPVRVLFLCGWVTDLLTFYEDYLKCIEFYEWLKEKAERQ